MIMLFKKKKKVENTIDIEALRKWLEKLNKMDDDSINFQYNRIYNTYLLWRDELKHTKEILTMRIGIIGALIAIYIAVFLTLFTACPSSMNEQRVLLYCISLIGLTCYSIYFYMNPVFTYDTMHYKSEIQSLPLPETYAETVTRDKRETQLVEIINWLIDIQVIKEYVETTNKKYTNKSSMFHIFVIESLILVIILIISSVSEVIVELYVFSILILLMPLLPIPLSKIAHILKRK